MCIMPPSPKSNNCGRSFPQNLKKNSMFSEKGKRIPYQMVKLFEEEHLRYVGEKNTFMLKPDTLLWILLPHTYIYTG
jgi:hypothetical protein